MPLFRKGEQPIDCPRCSVELKPESVKQFGPNLLIDVCPSCSGTWYDKGELAKVLEDRSLHERLVHFPKSGEKAAIACPRCGGEMVTRNEGDVEVDSCTSCTGVWLDRGEETSLKAKLEYERRGQTSDYQGDAVFYSLMHSGMH
jgi:Zn-finger nucleic acid-binding protein